MSRNKEERARMEGMAHAVVLAQENFIPSTILT